MASSRNGAVRGSMRPISGANSSNLRSSSFKSRIPSSAPAPRRNSTSAALGAADNGGPFSFYLLTERDAISVFTHCRFRELSSLALY